MLKFDGSILEGGGQILRNSVALAAILQKPVEVENIRNQRKKPGLKRQHLCGLQLVAELCHGTLTGGSVDSPHIQFYPGERKNEELVVATADTQTAGSICLLIQISLPVVLFGMRGIPVELNLKGGTNAAMAPQLDYFSMVLQPVLRERFAVDWRMDIVQRGFYPRGGGHVKLSQGSVGHLPLPPLTMVDRGDPVSIELLAYTAGSLPRHIAQRMASSVSKLLKKSALSGVPCHSSTPHWSNCVGAGCGLVVVLTTSTGCRIAGSALGQKGKPAERVAADAVAELLEAWSAGGCTDEYLQDQLIIFMSLAQGTSKLLVGGEPSLHTQTAVHFCGQMTGAQFTVTKQPENLYLIECKGIGFHGE